MRVGKRLAKILSLLNNRVGVVADIGTDHGILAFKILTQNKAVRVIATDVSAPSLQKAEKLKQEYNLHEEFKCVVGDGLKPLEDEKELDVVVVAGMGGNEIVKILNEQPKNLKVDRYIFQPMQDVEILRAFLFRSGYNILVDEMVKDRGKFYSTIVCECDGVALNPQIEDIVVGKTDRKKRGVDFIEWLELEIEKQLSREEFLNEEKRNRLNALKNIKLENEERKNI